MTGANGSRQREAPQPSRIPVRRPFTSDVSAWLGERLRCWLSSPLPSRLAGSAGRRAATLDLRNRDRLTWLSANSVSRQNADAFSPLTALRLPIPSGLGGSISTPVRRICPSMTRRVSRIFRKALAFRCRLCWKVTFARMPTTHIFFSEKPQRNLAFPSIP